MTVTGNISSVISWRKYFLGAFTVFFYLLTLSACKDPDEIGLEVQPASDQLSVLYSDTATVVTKTVKEDSILSKGVYYQLLGSYYDPVFGRSDAGFYTQASLTSLPTLGNSTDILIADSLVLVMSYGGYYGDTTTAQVARIYRLNADMPSDSGYYTSTNFSYDASNDLANGFSFYPYANGGTALRIPLSMTLASELLALNGQPAFADNTTWLQYFKGLFLKTDPENVPGKGAISYFNLYTGSDSRLTLYYKKVTATNDTVFAQHYDFSLSSGTLKANHQEHVYDASTPVGSQLLNPASGDSLNYIQSMAGVKTKITIPYIKQFLNAGNILVNKAELEITVQAGSTDVYAPPTKLLLVTIDSSGAPGFVADFFESENVFGGFYTASTRTYKFSIARQLQKILDGKTVDYGFYLLVAGAVVQANRVVIGSGSNTTYPMKLRLFYTKLH